MTSWLKNKLNEVTERTSIDTLNEIKPFIISSFTVLVDQIKEHLGIQCNFDIKEWYVLCNEKEPFDLVYDICIQTDLNTGVSHVSKKYKELIGYQLTYFIDFTFHYVNKNNETKILAIKEIVKQFIELI